ncbi:hypothetical protein [Allopontixanthobacter sediminis]|uniref:Uncharacterized protein n=1 Tax=Allopontixanthobacter sediminis TaxID=1689985 RepID=A0A845B8B4_9SPHN|nr:hypothetical protein [Allopontixanthobacter sediminis]MXP45667.1 hypothetical protein [Allopontixanthobacter sediminis]
MILRQVHGWQVLLADLSLILFITAAATISQPGTEAAPDRLAQQTIRFSPGGDTLPAAVYRVETGDGPDDLRAWISAYSPDPRESLDITIGYHPHRFDAAADRARVLMRQAQEGGQEPRITFEADQGEGITASFGFSGNTVVARKLLNTP